MRVCSEWVLLIHHLRRVASIHFLFVNLFFPFIYVGNFPFILIYVKVCHIAKIYIIYSF